MIICGIQSRPSLNNPVEIRINEAVQIEVSEDFFAPTIIITIIIIMNTCRNPVGGEEGTSRGVLEQMSEIQSFSLRL